MLNVRFDEIFGIGTGIRLHEVINGRLSRACRPGLDLRLGASACSQEAGNSSPAKLRLPRFCLLTNGHATVRCD
jgi:hypothetical protein